MNLLKSFEFIPGVKWFETEMHDSLFQHSVFGAIVFLIVSHTDVYKFVGQLIQVKDKNVLMLVHAVVFAVIMYFGSMYLFAPLLTEGLEKNKKLTPSDLTDMEARLLALEKKLGNVKVDSKKTKQKKVLKSDVKEEAKKY